jgi:hypothetical protein
MKFVEMEINTNRMHNLFKPPICAEVPLAWSHKNHPRSILEAEYHYSDYTRYTKNAKKHLA